jgi:hypothetical protein
MRSRRLIPDPHPWPSLEAYQWGAPVHILKVRQFCFANGTTGSGLDRVIYGRSTPFNSTVALPSYSCHDCCDGEDALCVPSPDLCMLSIPVAVGTRATPALLPHCRRRARIGRKRA